MLNYQDLSFKFTEKLNTFSKEQLLRWVEFDQYRDTISKLVEGETVTVINTILSQNKLSDSREDINLIAGNSSYAMAA
jgi:hypothetical protein